MRVWLIALVCMTACLAKPPGGSGDAGPFVDARVAEDGGEIVPVNCLPSNCQGCCKNDVCVDGAADDACGQGGIACDVCGTAKTCRDHLCDTICGPLTCAGCCKVGIGGIKQCLAGSDLHTCGKQGADCNDCGNSGLCSLGVCADPSCSSSCAGCCDGSTCHMTATDALCGMGGATCDDCSTKHGVCTQGACVIDPNSRWDVQLISGEMPPYKANGSNWDTFTQPDPYAIFTTTDASDVTTTMQSPYVDGTRTPSWDNLFLLSNVTAAQLKHYFKQTMFDYDSPDADDYVGECTTTFDDAQFDGSVWQFTCPEDLAQVPPRVEWSVLIRVTPH